MPRGVLPKNDYVDLSYVDVEDFLTALGVEVAYISMGNAGFKCPFHNDHRPSARMDIDTTAWLCNGCGEKGNAISFLVKIRDFEYQAAKRAIEDRYGGSLTAAIGDLEEEIGRILYGRELVIADRVPPTDEHLQATYVNWIDLGKRPSEELGDPFYYMLNTRGFSPSALDSWQVGFDDRSQRITIPIRDVDGRLVGFKGRSYLPDHDPKYLVLGDARLDDPARPPRYGFQTYRKSEYVFGLDRAIAADQRDLIVIEGELNVIAMDSYGYANAVGVAGSEFSETQAELIIRYADSVTIYFDDDRAGNKGRTKVVDALRDHIHTDVIVGAPGDANEIGPDGVASVLAGAKSSLLVEIERAIIRNT